jgi:hypothetical protein
MNKIKPFRINWSDKRTEKWKSYLFCELALQGKTLTGYVMTCLDKLVDNHIKRMNIK